MQFTKLSNIDLPFSKIGFGTWGLGGDSYGSVSKRQAIEVINFAFESGINFFDSADIYGNGKVEKLLGEIFSKNRNEVLISSKVGYIKYPSSKQIFASDFIRKRLEGSLKRLNTDYIDIYFLHSPASEILKQEKVFETMQKLKEEGKIKSIGVSVRTVADGLIASNIEGVETVQVILNILDQRAIESGLTTELKNKNKTIIARVPLCFGFISGKYTSSSKFKLNDHRKRWNKEQLEGWIATSKLFENYFTKLNEFSVVQNALKFTISQKCNSITIPGMKSIDQVEHNLKVLDIPEFNSETLSELFSIYQDNKCFPI